MANRGRGGYGEGEAWLVCHEGTSTVLILDLGTWRSSDYSASHPHQLYSTDKPSMPGGGGTLIYQIPPQKINSSVGIRRFCLGPLGGGGRGGGLLLVFQFFQTF